MTALSAWTEAEGAEPTHLMFEAGQMIEAVTDEGDGWLEGQFGGRRGVFPADRLQTAAQREVERAAAEAAALAAATEQLQGVAGVAVEGSSTMSTCRRATTRAGRGSRARRASTCTGTLKTVDGI